MPSSIWDIIGNIPYRMAFAGGWIDQPFVSQHDPEPPGSMVVVGLEPNHVWMERAGMATGTRKVARKLWGDALPNRPAADLVAELYEAENATKSEPSGSQDMIGLIYPGVNRLDFSFAHADGIFPQHIESCCDLDVAKWLERVTHVLPVAPRPEGYNPLGVKNLDHHWIRRLGESGKNCYEAICSRDATGLGASMNESMACWEAILPHTVRHPTITVDLMGIWDHYRRQYAGAMYSGCGGGYLYVVSEEPVPGSFSPTIRAV